MSDFSKEVLSALAVALLFIGLGSFSFISVIRKQQRHLETEQAQRAEWCSGSTVAATGTCSPDGTCRVRLSNGNYGDILRPILGEPCR